MDEVIQSSSHTYLCRKYEKQYKMLCHMPMSKKLVRRDTPGDFYDADAEGTFRRESKKIGRNDKCPCGSGKKYKNYCGRA